MSTIPVTPVLGARRLLVAIGTVGSPICLDLGNVLSIGDGASVAQHLRAIHAAPVQFLASAVLSAAGFALLGVVAVGIAMLLPRRGGALATIGAVITVISAVVMSGAVLTSAVVEYAFPVSAAPVLGGLQQDPAVGSLFLFGTLTAIGGLLAAIALLIGRTVGIAAPILLVVGIVLSNVSGGALSVLLSLPFLASAVLLGRALVRTRTAVAATVPEGVPA